MAAGLSNEPIGTHTGKTMMPNDLRRVARGAVKPMQAQSE
jgi:hypothetical protein